MSNSATPEPGTERTLRSSVRNPRRRQRQSDGDSLRTTAPRRKRSKLSEDTFAPRGSIEQQSDVGSAVEMNGHARGPERGRSRKESTPMLDATELPLRGGTAKKAGTLKHRALKGDGATVLAQNKLYSVKLLPSTPKELRQEGVEYRGSLGTGHIALAVTADKAYLWDYTAHTTGGNVKVFDLPFPAREGDALPFGALVGGNGGSADVGLVLISATTGKVVYYESIERAASLGLFQERRTGVEGTISGFSLSEAVTEVVSADHAGFILSLSSGRIIQLTLRDAQGKPRIFTQPLRPGDTSSGGFFGSIRGLLGGGWRRDVTAVCTRALDTRGQMQVLALTERCELQTWDVDWSGRYDFVGSMEFREALVHELKSLEPVESQGKVAGVVALDFVIADKPASAKGNEVATTVAGQPLSAWLLARVGSVGSYEYVLVDISLVGDNVNIERTMKLGSSDGRSDSRKPSLVVPKPGHTAFVAFEDGVTLASTTAPEIPDDPNAQLHEASYVDPQVFEDTVHLRKGKGLVVLGACAEDSRAGHATCVAFIKGAGVARFSATDPTGDVERSRLPVKTQIEQAVYYGAMQDNIIDFSRTDNGPYALEEVEEATLAVSDEILRSDTFYISTTPASIEAHLDFRARALRALVAHATQNYPPLSRAAMWQLLWDGEKVAAAQQMWKAFEEHKAAAQKANKNKRTATVIDTLCLMLDEELGLETLDQTMEDDLARRFFVKGLYRMEYVLSHIRNLLEALADSRDEQPQTIVRSVAEADDVWTRALDAVFNFRAENATAYGITKLNSDGVLTDPAEYANLPEFWTSSINMLKASAKIPKLSRDTTNESFENNDAPEVTDVVTHVLTGNAHMIQLCCVIYTERINWLSMRPSRLEQDQLQKLRANFELERYDQCRDLAGIGRAEDGMHLAEKYRDMPMLVELVVMETQYWVDELSAPNITPEQRDAGNAMLLELQNKTTRFFERFGDEWGNAFFNQAFSGSRSGVMLDESQIHWQQALTRYLRADQGRGKICWINDVTAGRDYRHAGVLLAQIALERESKTWCKKVELSLSKLALLAAEEKLAANKEAGGAQMKQIIERDEQELRVVQVQEKLHAHIRSEVRNALDEAARIELAMEKLGGRTADSTSLQRLLENGIERILEHHALSVEELIDVLTLMDSVIYSNEEDRPDGNFDGAEFALALTALDAAAGSMTPQRFQMLLQLIWKRCFLYDDWVAIASSSNTKGTTADSDKASRLHQTAPWRTLFILHDQGIFSRSDCHVRLLLPSECLGAGCAPEDLAYRFPEPELLDPILHDNRVQDEVLQSFVQDRGLDDWIGLCWSDVRATVERKGEEEAQRRKMERDVWVTLQMGAGEVNGQEDVSMG